MLCYSDEPAGSPEILQGCVGEKHSFWVHIPVQIEILQHYSAQEAAVIFQGTGTFPKRKKRHAEESVLSRTIPFHTFRTVSTQLERTAGGSFAL